MAIINEDQRWGFVHIPKTGGSTIHQVLAPGNWAISDHHSIATLRRIHKVPRDITWFFFSRNPYDRLISAWFTLKYELGASRSVVGPSFETFVLTRLATIKIAHFYPQIHWVETNNPKEDMIEGRFDNFEEDLRDIAAELGFDVPDRLPHIRKTRMKPEEKPVYTPAMIEVVNQVYREDFAYFDYPVLEVK